MYCRKILLSKFAVTMFILVLLLPLLKVGEIKASSSTEQQTKSIRIVGVVKEPSGEPAVGVTIMVKGTTLGTTTDIEGNYILSAPSDGTLTFSYMGFTTQEVQIKGRSSIDVNLVVSENLLEEVVVSVGYGTQRKITTIGAQSGIAQLEDLKQPVANLTNVISGRISGVVGVQRSGEPGSDGSDLWIRGISTFSNSRPLILVDGVERDFSNIEAEDIESFQILKDASATAVYGVKGANGVILITTKKGQKGKPRIRAEYNYGITNFTKVPDIADGVTYMQMANEALTTRGQNPIYSEERIRKTASGIDPILYPNVKWMDEIFQDFGHNQRINVNASGGSDFAQFYVSVGYYNEQGLYKTTSASDGLVHDGSINFTRYNFTSSLTMQATKTTEVVLGIKGYSSTKKAPSYSADDVFKMALKTYPILYPTDFYEGNQLPYISTGGGVQHPYGMLTQYGHKSEDKDQTYADLRATQRLDFIAKGLYAKALFSFDNYNYYSVTRKREPKTYYAEGRDADGNLIIKPTDGGKGVDYLDFNKSNSGNRRYYFEASLNYETLISDKHRVSGLFLFNSTDYLDKGAGSLISSQPYRSMGIAGRGTYSYDDKYLFEFNFGYNGSENFAPNKRYGFFPSVGLGWVVSSENFFEPVKPYVQFLKLRATRGQSGNDRLGDGARRFAYLPTVDDGGGGYTYGKDRGNSIGGYNVAYSAVNVTWETSTKTNLGLDMHLLDKSLVLQLDVFSDRRENIFLQRASVPDFAGIRFQDYGNLGIVENKGIEASVDWAKKFGEWNIGLKGTYTFNKSKIIEDDSPAKPYAHLETRGLSVNYRMGYICDRFYTDDDINLMKTQDPNNKQIAVPDDFDPINNNYMAGDLKYRDLTGDGIISDEDKTSIGKDQVPQLVYGFGANVGWRGFTLGAFFQGVAECDLLTLVDDFVPYVQGAAYGNVYSDIVNRWTPENQGQGAIYPRLSYGSKINKNYERSTFWLQSGAFLRLKTLDFGYTIPSEITKKWGVTNMRVYFLGNNLLTFSDFSRYDVELGSGTGTSYPNVRTYSLGFNFSF